MNHQVNNKEKEWNDVCHINDIPSMSGVCALHQEHQVAIFNLNKVGDNGEIRSISNFDPISKANVLSRGIVAEIDGRIVVSSPLLKQYFCLKTGECLQDESMNIPVYPVRIKNSRVQLKNI